VQGKILSLFSTVIRFAMDKNNSRTRIIRQSSGIYGLGFLGALVYFIQHASTFGMGALGVLKAIVWPAVLVYKSLEYLKM
jgi:hypothetical protein